MGGRRRRLAAGRIEGPARRRHHRVFAFSVRSPTPERDAGWPRPRLGDAQPAARPGNAGEGFGIVFLEAAALRQPVVAGNVGGALDSVADGESGLLVDPRDPSRSPRRSWRCYRRDLASRMGAPGAAGAALRLAADRSRVERSSSSCSSSRARRCGAGGAARAPSRRRVLRVALRQPYRRGQRRGAFAARPAGGVAGDAGPARGHAPRPAAARGRALGIPTSPIAGTPAASPAPGAHAGALAEIALSRRAGARAAAGIRRELRARQLDPRRGDPGASPIAPAGHVVHVRRLPAERASRAPPCG